MIRCKLPWAPGTAAMLVFSGLIFSGLVLAGPVQAAQRTSHVSHARASTHMQVRYADRSAKPSGRGHSRLTALVGDRESGLGFYALPARYRTRAALGDPDRRGDAIRYAVASEAGGYPYGLYDGEYGARHRHTVFNPVDGYGSPFFAGYYGPAGDPDEDRGLFGRPYD